MNRTDVYIESFAKAPMARKIKAVKAMEHYLKLDAEYIGITNTIDSIAEVLESVFPNKWDIILKKRRLRDYNDNGDIEITNYKVRPFTLEFTIHFPKIRILNSRKNSHTVTDLFIKLIPISRTDKTFSFKNFEGKRLSASREEIYSEYQHSHLPSRKYTYVGEDEEFTDSSALCYRRFCLGSSEVVQALTMLSCGYTEGNLRLFLFQLEEYLNWESIEGVPHIHFSKVTGQRELSYISVNTVKNHHKAIQDREIKKELDFTMKKGTVKVVDNEKLEEYLRLSSEHTLHNSNVVASKDKRGNYFSFVSPSTGDISSYKLGTQEELNVAGFMFRGQRVDFKIVESTVEINKEFYIHKQIKDYVTEAIEQNIKTKELRGYISEQLSAIRDTPESTRQDRLFMPSN